MHLYPRQLVSNIIQIIRLIIKTKYVMYFIIIKLQQTHVPNNCSLQQEACYGT